MIRRILVTLLVSYDSIDVFPAMKVSNSEAPPSGPIEASLAFQTSPWNSGSQACHWERTPQMRSKADSGHAYNAF